MADQTTTTTTTTHSTSVAVNINYVTSVPGLLKVGEIVFGLLSWALTASIYYGWSAHQFVMFVTVTAWILTIILFIIYFFGWHATRLSGAPWAIIEFFFNVFWAFFYVVAALVSATHTGRWPVLIAATVFIFITAILYCIHAFICFRAWRGTCTCTTTSTTRETTVAA